MANHKSAAKRARQSVRKTAVNTRRKSKVKTFEKDIQKALSAKSVKTLPELLRSYSGEVMKAAQRGVFKKEMASRKIGRLAKRIQALITSK